MTGKSHVTIGVITYATLWIQPLGGINVPLLADTHSVIALPIALALVLLGSLLPDLDHRDGRLANERILGVPLLKPFAWLINKVFGHRGATHSLLALAGIVVIGELLFLPWIWAHLVGVFATIGIALSGDVPLVPWRGAHLGLLLGWGYAFHLLADGFTKAGVPLLWPLDNRFGIPPFRSLRFTTGTWREGLTVACLTIACLVNAARALIG